MRIQEVHGKVGQSSLAEFRSHENNIVRIPLILPGIADALQQQDRGLGLIDWPVVENEDRTLQITNLCRGVVYELLVERTAAILPADGNRR